MNILKSQKFWYITLFAILYCITAWCSFWHAVSFFGLANNEWMSYILAFAFEVGQAAVLFSLLTSQKDRSRVIPWVLMFIFTSVQVVGNVFSSYKHIMLNSVEDLKYFKEPIFIWTDLPDKEATVIVTWAIGAILPIASLLLTSMITNYLEDTREQNVEQIPEQVPEQIPQNVEQIKETEPQKTEQVPEQIPQNVEQITNQLKEQKDEDIDEKPIERPVEDAGNNNEQAETETVTAEHQPETEKDGSGVENELDSSTLDSSTLKETHLIA